MGVVPFVNRVSAALIYNDLDGELGARSRPARLLRGIARLVAELDDVLPAPAAQSPASDMVHEMRVYPRCNGKINQARCRNCMDKQEECWTTRYCATCTLDLCVPSNTGASRDCWGEHRHLPPSEILRMALPQTPAARGRRAALSPVAAYSRRWCCLRGDLLPLLG
eukprot:jgi/Tetstr1/458533/TSEL_044936.t1